jgi:shikimate kinase
MPYANIVRQNNIFLIGPMGAGKTSIGKSLSQLLGLTFYDTDHEIQKQTGVTLAWVLHIEKEEGLRKREHSILKSLVKKKNIVLATGGGIVVFSKNHRLLKKHGLIIYLRTSLNTQASRTRFSKDNRPLLDTDDLAEKILELHQEREPLYSKLANLTYETQETTPHQLALKIYRDLKKYYFSS